MDFGYYSKLISIIFAGILITASIFSSANAQSITEEDYQRAESMLSWNLSDKLFKTSVYPNWIDNNRFWYRLNIKDGIEYVLVDASRLTRERAFDHEQLSREISRVDNNEVSPLDMRLSSLSFSDDLGRIDFEYRRNMWSCTLSDYRCEITGEVSRGVPYSITSPDGKYAAYTQDHNLWVRDLESGDDIQLTSDGDEFYAYAKNNQGWNRSERPILLWSPDSEKISTFRLDERGVEKMVLWSAEVGRPKADIWPYALPGDSVVPMLERVVIDVEEREVVMLDIDPDHQRASNCCGLERGLDWVDNEWSSDSQTLSFVSTSRDYKDVALRVADPNTGAVRTVYEDRDDASFESNLTSRGVPNWRVLHDSNEFIWFNRSTNWGHLYLHDLETGELKNAITSGNWNVVDILRINEEERTIHFTAVAKEEGLDPYHENLYRVNFDGSDLTRLTPQSGNHTVYLSPDASYIVNTYSDFETPPTSVVRDGSGELVMGLENADVSELFETGWQAPISFNTKARDGETDIYGVMILPSNFDENKTYPIVNAIYPGPQTGSVGSRNFSHSRRGQAHALAELGFVVVAVDALGSSPIRSRDFHTAYKGDMIDNGLEDQILAMQYLADEYSFIDIDRAGIYGHSGGGFATAAALTQYPDFFKVGVAGAGNLDNRNYTYYWGEKYQGLLEEEGDSDNFESSAVQLQAENLIGKLLISYGTMDTNVHPGMSQLFINELIRHNKDFDTLVMPNRGHGYANEPYNIRRTWDYFVKHLAGQTPPKEYEISR